MTQADAQWDEILGDRVIDRGVEGGVEWLIAEAPMAGVNGYVQLPEGHPWREYDLQGADWNDGPEIHGGVTFGPDSDGWIGFDTSHAYDIWPDMGRLTPLYKDMPASEYDTHWTVDKVREETLDLARQVVHALR